MSTRCNIILIREGQQTPLCTLYKHRDGYPKHTGRFIIQAMKVSRGDRDILANLLLQWNWGDDIQIAGGIAWDGERLYTIVLGEMKHKMDTAKMRLVIEWHGKAIIEKDWPIWHLVECSEELEKIMSEITENL